MTPSEACDLLERRREMWPEWMSGCCPLSSPGWGMPEGVEMKTANGLSFVAVGTSQQGVRARVRPGLPDEENVRRILAAAEKGYRQRLQAEQPARDDQP